MEEMINANGTELINADGPAAASEVSVNQLYKKSGTNIPFKDWLNDMQSSGKLDELKQKALDEIKKRKGGGGNVNTTTGPTPNTNNQLYILGMRPFVAVMVGVTAISLLAYGGYQLYKHMKK